MIKLRTLPWFPNTCSILAGCLLVFLSNSFFSQEKEDYAGGGVTLPFVSLDPIDVDELKWRVATGVPSEDALATLAHFRGRYVWAIAAAAQVFAMGAAVLFSLWCIISPLEVPYMYGLPSDGKLCVSLRRIAGPDRLPIIAAIVVTSAILVFFKLIGFRIDIFSVAGANHGRLFEKVFELSRSTHLRSWIDVGNCAALLMATTGMTAVYATLGWLSCEMENSTAPLVPYQLHRARLLRTVTTRLEHLATTYSIALAICIFQISALARWPASQIACEDTAKIIQGFADAATFGAGAALSILMSVLFISAAAVVLDERSHCLSQLSRAVPCVTNWEERTNLQWSGLEIVMQLFKTLSPILIGTVAGFVGVGLK